MWRGEIGFDLYWDKTTLAIQHEAFERQVAWAKELGLPIVIHVREAFEALFEAMDRLNDDRLSGVVHCFTGNLEQARACWHTVISTSALAALPPTKTAASTRSSRMSTATG